MKTLKEAYQNYSMSDCGGDKGTMHSYIEVYEQIFKDRNRENINILEIGVYEGHSLMMWSEYFINSKIIGIDIDLGRVKYNYPEKFELIQADATKDSILEHPSICTNQFDYIIDDGSHRIEDQITSCRLLYKSLKPDGIYIIEDIANLDIYRPSLLSLGSKVEIFDLRSRKNRYDDVLITIKNG